MPRKQRLFVKAADTRTPVGNSRAEVDRMLRRYGAAAISMSENIETRQLVVSFVIPNSLEKGATKVPVRLEISILSVYIALFGRPAKSGRVIDLPPAQLERAERVAWRNLVLWIDAALSAATIGLQTITEAFFAHTVVGSSGERMIRVVEEAQASLGPGVQRLLSSESEP